MRTTKKIKETRNRKSVSPNFIRKCPGSCRLHVPSIDVADILMRSDDQTCRIVREAAKAMSMMTVGRECGCYRKFKAFVNLFGLEMME